MGWSWCQETDKCWDSFQIPPLHRLIQSTPQNGRAQPNLQLLLSLQPRTWFQHNMSPLALHIRHCTLHIAHILGSLSASLSSVFPAAEIWTWNFVIFTRHCFEDLTLTPSDVKNIFTKSTLCVNAKSNFRTNLHWSNAIQMKPGTEEKFDPGFSGCS